MPMVLLAFGLGILNVCLGFANYASYMPAMQSSETTFSLFQPFSASFRLRCDMLRHAATCCDISTGSEADIFHLC